MTAPSSSENAAAGSGSPPGRSPETGKGRWRPTIGVALSAGFGLLVLVAVSLVLWIALGTAQKNTFSLVSQTAELTVESLIGEIAFHLGAAREQAVFLGGLIDSGEVDAEDLDRMGDAMMGALAAAPQVTGIAYFSVDGWSLRVGRGPEGLMRLHDKVEPDPGIPPFVADMAGQDGATWGGVFWVPSLNQPQMAVSVPLRRSGEYLGVISSVVSLQVLSSYVEDFDLQTGLHAFVLYGSNKVMAHPAMVDSFAGLGLGPEKALPDLDEVGDPVLAEIWSEDKEDLSILRGSGSALLGHFRELDDDQAFYLYRVIGGYGPEQLYMGVHFLESENEDPEFDRLELAAWVGLGILVVSLLTAVVLGRGISRPVREFAAAARAISTFDFRQVPPAKGSALRELDSAAKAFNAMLSGLRWFETYVPRSLVLRLINLGEEGISSEERQVTVIFTDIVGFTAASQNMSAEELSSFLNHHFELLATEVEKTGGTVDKYIGDSVMAFWGAPDDQPDHAERAVAAARGIAAALERDNRALAAKGQPPVHLRIGIHSGSAIVGNIGAPGRINYTLIGDTVNLANRLEAFGKEVPAGEGSAVILMSGATRRLLGDKAQVEDLGVHEVRGRVGRTEIFRLLT